MNKSPLIIFHVQAHKYYKEGHNPKNHIEADRMNESNFFRCKSSDNILSYLTRKDASEKISIKDAENIQKVIDFNLDSTYLNYQNERPGSTGSFDKNGDISKQKLQEYKTKLQNTKSCIWSSIISFTPEYSDVFVKNKKQAFDTISNTIEHLFKSCNLDPKNMEWTCAYHTNTDNRHCHLLFWEKEPTELDCKGHPRFSNWRLPKESLENWKSSIAYYHQSEPLKYLSLRTNITDSVSSIIRNDQSTYLALLDIEIKNVKSYQYARVSSKNQDIIKNCITRLLYRNPNLYSIWDSYLNHLMTTQCQIIKNCQEVGVNPSPEQLKFMSSRISELFNRCGNTTLKALKDYREANKEKEQLKKEIRTNAKLAFRTSSSANTRRFIYNTSRARYKTNGKIAYILESMIMTIASDISKEHKLLDAYIDKRKDDELLEEVSDYDKN